MLPVAAGASQTNPELAAFMDRLERGEPGKPPGGALAVVAQHGAALACAAQATGAPLPVRELGFRTPREETDMRAAVQPQAVSAPAGGRGGVKHAGFGGSDAAAEPAGLPLAGLPKRQAACGGAMAGGGLS